MRKWNNIFWIMVVVVFGILFIWGIDTGLQRIEVDRNICSEYDMTSITINRSRTVFCVDDKGQVFYLRERNVE